MTLIERLRLEAGEPIARRDCLEAADTIERLTRERDAFREELWRKCYEEARNLGMGPSAGKSANAVIATVLRELDQP